MSCFVVCLLGPLSANATVFFETEPNNSFAQADSLNPHDSTIQVFGTYNGPDSNGFIDDDFFLFRASAGDVINVGLTPDITFGNFSLFLYNPNQTFTGVAVFGNHPSFVFPVVVTGDSYITVAAIAPSFRSGTYVLNIAGLTASVAEPSTFWLLAAALGCVLLLGVGNDRRGAVEVS
jgi:hypothetical protein